jgi:hypothetical protein
MWRLVLVCYLLISVAVFAGESRQSMKVGITITGKGNSSAVSAKTDAGANAGTVVSVPLPTRRPAAIGPHDTTPSTQRSAKPGMTDASSAGEHLSGWTSITVNEE